MALDEVKDLTDTIGGCGPFQVFMVMAVHSVTMTTAWGLLFMAFGMYNPGWTCLDNIYNGTTFPPINISTDIMYSPVQEPATLYNATSSIANNMTDTIWYTSCTSKRSQSCKKRLFREGSSTVVTEWNLVCDLAWVPSAIISIQMVGNLIGSYLGGQISDLFGRKIGLYSLASLHALAHLLAIFSVSWPMYAVIQFFIGMSSGGIIILVIPYTLEFTNEWWRGVLTSIPFWPLSYITFSVGVYILRDWKNLHIAAVVYNSLVLLIGFWTPESVRWLAVKGKVGQAKALLKRIARLNGKPCPDTSIVNDIAQEEKRKMGNHRYTCLDLFRIPALRPHTIKFGLIWMMFGYTYYVISFSTSALYGDFYVNLLLSAVTEFPGLLILAPLVNRLGRRKAALVLLFIEVICNFLLVVMTFITSGGVKEKTLLGLSMFSKILAIATWTIFVVYPAEIFPTVVRHLIAGFLGASARVGSIVSPYLVPQDPNKFYVCFIIIGIISIIRFLITLSLPESKGQNMKDLAFEKRIIEKQPMNDDLNEEL